MSQRTSDDVVPNGERRPVYVERVNAAIDYIEAHLADEITLSDIADVAHFSPFHFHRVFAAITGETLGHFITRTRLERAASLLLQHPRRTVTEVASEVGFPNPSSFSRAFRKLYGMSATDWRRGGYQEHIRVDRLPHADARFGILSRESVPGRPPTWQIRCGDLPPTSLTVVNVPDLEVAYVRHTGSYQGQAEVFADIFNRLMSWAEPRGLITPETWILAVYHDNPSITADDLLRVSACISVPPETAAMGDVGRMSLQGGTTAVARFELGDQDYGQAWQAIVAWLPDSGYEPDDRLPYERYFTDQAAPSGKEIVEIHLPVRPLRIY